METGNNIDRTLQVNATSLRNRAAKNSNDGKELGKQDFLNLLMTQMANQDPLDPMDSEGMMRQLASLGTVEQLQNLNNQTAKMMEVQRHIARSTAGSLLGKDVEVGAREIPLRNGETFPVTYKLEGSADRVMLLVQDSTGEMIREINLESRAKGTHEFSWDGRDNDGDTAFSTAVENQNADIVELLEPHYRSTKIQSRFRGRQTRRKARTQKASQQLQASQ